MINIKRILCPTDLSAHSGKAVRYAASLARAHEAELIFFHCTPDSDVGEAIVEQALVENVDLIVMRSRRRPPCPVLVARPLRPNPANSVTPEILSNEYGRTSSRTTSR